MGFDIKITSITLTLLWNKITKIFGLIYLLFINFDRIECELNTNYIEECEQHYWLTFLNLKGKGKKHYKTLHDLFFGLIDERRIIKNKNKNKTKITLQKW